ncbi:hypothetical protein [Massilia sp. TWR1-2-2]|uniref:hypothetical protein n=1 Tax=Massilia sp. TWR1-2-2 TaxID=2804584 RepID=UPI003CF28BC4
MPSDLDPLFEAGAPPSPPSPSDQQHARDELELVSLRATVVRLLEEIRVGSGQAPIDVAAARRKTPVDTAHGTSAAAPRSRRRGRHLAAGRVPVHAGA